MTDEENDENPTAGFNSNNITTIGNPGERINSQSLQAGFVGNCGTTTITVSH